MTSNNPLSLSVVISNSHNQTAPALISGIAVPYVGIKSLIRAGNAVPSRFRIVSSYNPQLNKLQ